MLVYSLLVYFPLTNARLLVTRIFPLGNYSFARLLVYSYNRILAFEEQSVYSLSH
jgi:hypothetical protein